MTNQERLRELQKSLDIDNILLAEAFIATNLKQLKLRKNTKIYVAAVDFIASKIKRGQSPLSKRDLTQLQKDEASKTVGSVHKKLKQEFENIIKLYAITVDADPPPSRQRIGERSPLPNPNPTGQHVPARKPEVELTSNEKRVEKGGSVILTWKSKHAVRVKRTNIPGVRTNQVNGTTVVDDIRRRRDFYIIVEGADKQTAEDKVVTLIETQRFLQGKDDPEPVVSNQRQRQTPSSGRGGSPPRGGGRGTQATRVVSPSAPTSAVEENKEPVIETRSNSLSNDILSSIDKSLENILKLLKSQLKLNETVLVSVRRSTEEEKRQAKEKEMEEGGLKEGLKIMKDAGKKILSPFKDIIDKIVRFIFFTFLGKAFTEIVKWFNDPENKDKVEAMGRFLKDFWPLIAGVAVLVLTPLGGLIVSIVKFFGGAIKTLKALGSIIKTIFKGGGKAVAPAATRAGARTATAVASRAAARSGANVATAKSPNLLSRLATSGPLSKLTGKLLGKSAAKAIPFLGAIYGAIEGTSRLASGDVEGALLSYLGGVPVLGWGAVGLDAYRELDPEGYKKNIRAGMSIEEINKVLADAFSTAGSAMAGGMGGTSLNGLTSGGKIFSGLVGPNDGMKVSGAGKDTQMFPIAGGGAAILQPGELVLQPKAVNKLLKLGIDPLALNEGPSANKPKTINSGNISLMNTGGVVGGPNISAADYNTLLAIAALESDRPQGRADVAQSIYNRMLAASKYGVNFLQKSNSLKDLILARNQYQPTFLNQKDWQNISKDVTSAAIAVMNSDKGKRYKWDMNEAMSQIRATEKALKDPILQKNAAKFVKGIPSFRGTSEQKSMRPDLGDVLRNKRDNFFTTLDLEKTPYPKSQWAVAAPIPRMLITKPQEQPKPKPQPNLLQQAGQFFGGIGDKIRGMFTPKKKKGGLVDYSSGETLQGRASDSILSRLEKGEYVIPKMAVALIGTDLLDRVSALDPNSEAYPRVSRMELNIPRPRPFSQSSPQISTETLPPIMQGGYGAPSGGSGTPIPPITPSSSQEQAKAFNAAILGIV